MLKFPDGTQVRVNGLSEILADLYSQGKQANRETIEEIMMRLEEKNHIPLAEGIRNEYRHILLKEYGEYVESRADHHST
ncbi:MAG: hypothetical protein A4E57_02786 [Syntrophorhabdaceae bacterium PtaU1.Bin034]|jgi:hypothetical protein|nr:MAG: hypothetical protein A4E57_02786 [Syntrophorhabdaceae bacterium PtaU1.Bin034]